VLLLLLLRLLGRALLPGDHFLLTWRLAWPDLALLLLLLGVEAARHLLLWWQLRLRDWKLLHWEWRVHGLQLLPWPGREPWHVLPKTTYRGAQKTAQTHGFQSG
jgi:hypothetical protein